MSHLSKPIFAAGLVCGLLVVCLVGHSVLSYYGFTPLRVK
jgi:hypothetical protein